MWLFVFLLEFHAGAASYGMDCRTMPVKKEDNETTTTTWNPRTQRMEATRQISSTYWEPEPSGSSGSNGYWDDQGRWREGDWFWTAERKWFKE